MGTINGIGTKFYGIKGPNEKGTCTTTLWFTFLYLPIFPIARYEIIRHLTKPRDFVFNYVQKLKLNLKEILITYLLGWIVIPFLWFSPLFFGVKEVGMYLGYTNENAEGVLYFIIIFLAISYLIFFTIYLGIKMDKKGLPKNYKELLKQQQNTKHK